MGCSREDVYERLDFDSAYGYFNAGVLLINLSYWREHKLSRVFLNYISEKNSKIIAHDQDVLNAILHDKCVHLPYKWNVEEGFYHYWFIKKNHFDKKLCHVLRTPGILHYTWKPKPWNAECKHPFRIAYFVSLQKTVFRMNVRRYSILSLWIDKYWFCLMMFFRIHGKRFYRLK